MRELKAAAPPQVSLEEADREALLAIARAAVAAAAEGRALDAITAPSERDALSVPAGAFVTLYDAQGELRGCIGTFDTSRPLWQSVRSMGAASATRDTRFEPVSPAEVAGLRVAISVLTPPRPVRTLDAIDPARHGLVVARGFERGVLLNKVARERSWDRETFLSATCRKAGLAPEVWRRFGEPGEPLEVSVFEELDFAEPVTGAGGPLSA